MLDSRQKITSIRLYRFRTSNFNLIAFDCKNTTFIVTISGFPGTADHFISISFQFCGQSICTSGRIGENPPTPYVAGSAFLFCRRILGSKANAISGFHPSVAPRFACQPMCRQHLHILSCHFLLRCQYCTSVCPLQMGINRVFIVFQLIVGDHACIPVGKQKHRDKNRFRLLHADSQGSLHR